MSVCINLFLSYQQNNVWNK